MEKVKEKKVSFITKVKLLLKSVREFKLPSILSIVFITGETAFECIIPFVMSMLLNEMTKVSESGDNSALLKSVIFYALILIALSFCSFGCGVMSGRVAAKAATGFTTNLRHDVFVKTTEFSFNNIDKISSASLITRETTDIANIQMSYQMMIRICFRAPLMFIFSLVMAMIMAFDMSWIFAITIPAILIPLVIGASIAVVRFNKIFRKFDDLNEKVEENVRGIRVVKTYAHEEFEKEKFGKESKELAKGLAFVEQLMNASSPIIQFVMYVSMVLILFFGSTYIINNSVYDEANNTITYLKMNVGQLSQLITYGAQVLSSLMMLTMVGFMIIMSVPCINRVYEVLTEEPTIKNCANPVYEVKDGTIEFKNVSFKYNEKAEKFAIQNVNLKINNGETIGIIGGTGSSKSTLVSLLSRFYDVTDGEILIGGINVKNYDLVTLRDKVSMVLQKNVLFSGTIEENIKWGNKNATHDEVVRVCKIAQADPFITAHEEGYSRHIEQGGSNVSGGQRQRLCIARALLKNPKVLILDDSTSAVDTKTDAYIRKGLRENLTDVTKIIIAQRISSVQDADRIIVLDNGTISGFGTHEELLKSNAIYKEVYELQNRIGGR